ncbi:MAG TPA: tetratricopeptide repeat protein [Rhodocyclaceae bacterium]|nr:tetratricopeptide repeat protein [Rhodocyclaceae bacterium]
MLPAVLATLALSAQANEAAVPASDAAADGGDSADTPKKLPKQELTPQIVYELLLAEIAGSRGQTTLSSEAYLDLARSTRDPRVARRAAEVAVYAHRYDLALDAAKLWAETEPDSPQPGQMVIALLAASGQGDALAAELSKQLAAGGRDGIAPQLLQLNRVMARFQDKNAALGVVDKVTAPYLDMPEAHFARAQASHSAGDITRAVAELDRAMALRPGWEPGALARAQLMTDSAAASHYLGDFVAANPKARDARLAYARSLVGLKRYAEARREFETLLTDHQGNGDVVYAVAMLSLQLNDVDEAEKELKRLVEMNHAEADAARLYLGQIEDGRKRPDEALKWYGQVASGSSQYLPARMRMAQTYAHEQKIAEARAVLQESVASDVGERSQLLIAESQVLREAGRTDEAYAVLADGLAGHPDQPDLLYEAALLAERVGKLDVVEADLRRLIELKPDYAHAYNALGYSFADHNVHLDEAQRLIDKALQLSPDDPFILDSKGWVLFRRGDNGGALDALNKAFALRADPEIAAHLGEVLWAMGRKDEARKTWGDALKANPGNDVLVGTVKKFAP